jgi:hypothetical protein
MHPPDRARRTLPPDLPFGGCRSTLPRNIIEDNLMEGDEMQDRTKEAAVRKVIVSEFVSLDGVMEDPSWESPFRGEEQEKFKFDELAAADALLLGRKTYEGFAAAWPDMMEHYEGPRREALGEYTRHDERLPQARGLHDPPGAARVEQLDDHKGEYPRRG